jgi:hypothetical protein
VQGERIQASQSQSCESTGSSFKRTDESRFRYKTDNDFLYFISNLCTVAGGYEFWLSATDIGQKPGIFRWLDGTNVDSLTWERTYADPNEFGQGKETSAFLSVMKARLYDGPCYHLHSTLCEVSEPLSSCF